MMEWLDSVSVGEWAGIAFALLVVLYWRQMDDRPAPKSYATELVRRFARQQQAVAWREAGKVSNGKYCEAKAKELDA